MADPQVTQPAGESPLSTDQTHNTDGQEPEKLPARRRPHWAPSEPLWLGKKTHEWVIQCFGAGESARSSAAFWASEEPERRRVWSQPPPGDDTVYYKGKPVPATAELVES